MKTPLSEDRTMSAEMDAWLAAQKEKQVKEASEFWQEYFRATGDVVFAADPETN